MKKKLLISLTIFVFAFSIFLQPKSTQAVTGAVAKVVAGSVGERVVVGIAEKAGMKYVTKTARKRAVEKWNLEVYEKIKYYDKVGEQYKADELRRFQDNLSKLDNTSVVSIPESPSLGKVLLEGALFLTGADIALDIQKGVTDAFQSKKYWETMKEAERALENGEVVSGKAGVRVFTNIESKPTNPTWYLGVDYPTESALAYSGMITGGTGTAIDFSRGVWTSIVSANVNETSRSVSGQYYYYYYEYPYSSIPQTKGKYTFNFNYPSGVPIENFERVSIVPSINNVPQVTEVPWLQPYAETEAIPENMPNTVDVTIPLDDSYPEDTSVPWNEPVTDFPADPVPETPPADDTGIDWSWWNWLKDLLQKILDGINGIVTGIVSGITSIFVPDAVDLQEPIKDLKTKLEFKLPLIPQLHGFFGDIKDLTFSPTIPTFNITFPEKWGGGTYSIIDFKYFTDYRMWVINFIRFTAWYMFLRRLYNRIPRMVY